MQKKLLLITYTLPPFPGIGGRRWAKFCHYLALNGYEVHVICSQNPFKEQSSWNKDIEHPNIHVHLMPVNYPKVLLHGPKNLLDKLIYRFWKAYLSIYSKGTVLERTIFWKKNLEQLAGQIIEKEKIQNLVVTIPPYRLAYYAAGLKKRFQGINFIVDYRDPWTDNKSFHGFKNISPSRLQHEQQMEQEALNMADHVFTVSDKMTENLKQRCKEPAKISTLLNGFDPADISTNSNVKVKKETGKKIQFIYAGTLYSNLEYIITPLLSYLDELKKTNNTLYNSLSFEFYGKHNIEAENKIKQFNSPVISIHTSLPLNEIQEKLYNATFGILMSAEDHSFAFNTKFFEYLANRKPVLLFSYPGETSEFLVKNKLGYHINPATLKKDMDFFFVNINSIVKDFNMDFNISPYSIPSLTLQLEKHLK